MPEKREIEVVIRARDEFSGAVGKMERLSERSASRINDSFSRSLRGFDASGIDKYASSLERVNRLEAEAGRAKAQRRLYELESASPYGVETDNQAARTYIGYEQKLAALRSYNTAVLDEMAKAGRSQDEIEAAHAELSISYARKKRDFQIAAAAQSFGAASNFMQNLFVVTGSKNRAIFETMKAFAIAQTIMDTYKGATAAYAALAGIPVIGPALGMAAAATAIAAGMARVAQIRSTQPGGAGSSISGGGHANPQYSGGSPSAYPVPSRFEEKPVQHITVQIHNPLSEQNWKRIVEDDIIPAINDAVENRNISITLKNAG